jgi:hypothetical protein
VIPNYTEWKVNSLLPLSSGRPMTAHSQALCACRCLHVLFCRLIGSARCCSASRVVCGEANFPLHFSGHLKITFYLKNCLLSFCCCTRGTLWHLQKCLQYILVKLTPSTILLYPTSFHS